ncbi:MAG: TIGR01777 family protein [Verrucomicrobia bacterium]|nr:TIGR01777 family protein [Verrucomicrobiota bacterium]
MNDVILAGGSGFLGQLLRKHFVDRGAEVVVLTRSPRHSPDERSREVFWDAQTVGAWQSEVAGADVVINLTGRTVNCRYNARNRREILESRIRSTTTLGEAIARCPNPPKVWLNASTATIYRHTFGPAWNESGVIAGTAAVNDEFSVEVAQAWEKALDEAPTSHTRKVALRTAMVLGHGGNSVFPTLRRLVRGGMGGRMGDGRQFVSWIHQLDFCRAIEFVIAHEDLAGAINLCAPAPLTNDEMMTAFRRLCGIPVGLPAMRWMLEIGAFILRTETELILKSRRVIPGCLLKSGFQFQFPQFENALRDLLATQP